MESPLPGDFLPVGETIGLDTVALLPPGMDTKSTGWNGLGRASLHGALDLVTGTPFIRFTDLSLPFGGAEFRMIRTRSASRLSTGKQWGLGGHTSQESDWWDWAGSGWMMSENPILLIDSTMPDHVGAGGMPRCWLWLDAFHSIPFDWVETESGHGYYDCAPRFRAKMVASRATENGRKRSDEADSNAPRRRTVQSEDETFTTDGVEWKRNYGKGQWELHPDRFEISLYDGEIVYEFTPVWQDVPSWEWKYSTDPDTKPNPITYTSLHERPLMPQGDTGAAPALSKELATWDPWTPSPVNSNSSSALNQNGRGLGIPYYGLLSTMRDRYGNRAELSYAPLLQWDIPAIDASSATIAQTTTQKGCLREVKLFPADATEAAWTIVYSYRLVPRGNDQKFTYSAIMDNWTHHPLEEQIAWSDPALECAYVFEGDISTRGVTLLRSPNESLWTSAETPTPWPTEEDDLLARYQEEPESLEAVWEPRPYETSELKTATWRFRTRYYYKHGATEIKPESTHTFYEGVLSPPLLGRTETQINNADPEHPEHRTSKNLVFQYSSAMACWAGRWLESVYDEAGVSLVHGLLDSPPATVEETRDNMVQGHRGVLHSQAGPLEMQDEKTLQDYHDAARVWLVQSTVDSSRWPSTMPTAKKLTDDALFSVDDADKYIGDTSRGVVSQVSLLDEEGRKRHYRISRLLKAPGGFTGGVSGEFKTTIPTEVFPEEYAMRSIFLSPYWWQAYAKGNDFRWPTLPGGATMEWHEPDSSQTSGYVAKTQDSTAVDYSISRWITIIDEFPNWERAGNAPPTTIGSKQSFFENQLSRRIVGMNPQGVVLWEKMFTISDDHFAEGGNSGFEEQFVYKSGQEILEDIFPSSTPTAHESFATERFLVARKTAGWAAAAMASQGATKGLIEVYRYADVSNESAPPEPGDPTTPGALTWGERIKPIAEGIKQGDTGTEYFTRQTIYQASDPTVVLASAQFVPARTATYLIATPFSGSDTQSLESSGILLSQTKKIKTTDSLTGLYTKMQSVSVSPRHHSDPGSTASTTSYYDVSATFTGRRGQTVWSISALLNDPSSLVASSSDPLERVQLTYNKYDDYGRPTDTWVDVDPSDPPAGVTSEDLALLPSGIVRKGGGAEAAEYHSSYSYDWDGLSDIAYPNGKFWARRITQAQESGLNNGLRVTRVMIFNDLTEDSVDTGQPQTYTAHSLGLVLDYSMYKEATSFLKDRNLPPSEQTTLLQSRKATYTSAINLSDPNSTTMQFVPSIELGYDSAGRISRLDLMEYQANGNTMAVSATILDNVDRIRKKDLDGSISIQTRNTRGQLVRTYAGTNDTGWNDNGWPTVAPGGGFDMMLKDRVELGQGPNDALQPVRQWTYLKQPNWTTDQLAPFGEAPANDTEGELTRTGYDWRMRPVRVDAIAPNDGSSVPRLSTRLSYLDDADRPVLEVSYGAGTGELTLASGLDPTTFGPTTSHPSISSVLNSDPISVVQTSYYDDGLVREKRTYRPHGTGYSGSTSYTLERFGYAANGKQIFAQRSGSPIQVTTLDNMGRVLSDASVLPRGSGSTTTYDYELTRTDYKYDSEASVILTDRWERINPPQSSSESAGNQSLSSANAVRQRTENWYDPAKRLIATAEYGSGNDTFTTSDDTSPTHSDYSSGPKLLVSGSPATYTIERGGLGTQVRLTVHAYDSKGQKIASATTAGVITTFEYDAKGRLYRQIENATADAASQRETRYTYWLGKVVAISSNRRNEADETRQFQAAAYGAQIVAETTSAYSGSISTQSPDLTYISNSNALVGVMMSVNPDLTPADGNLGKDDSGQLIGTWDLIKGIGDFQMLKPDFIYRYYADGLLAERVDRRGVALRYFYDEHRRLREQEVWHYPLAEMGHANPLTGGWLTVWQPPSEFFSPGTDRPAAPVAKRDYPDSMIPGGGLGVKPVDRIGFIAYSYDSAGNLTRTTARESRVASAIIAETKYEYDERNNLTKEYQAHGVSADASNVPFITYARTYTGATGSSGVGVTGRDRLTGMTYPAHSGIGFTANRSVTFGYGTAGYFDDWSERIASIATGSSGTVHVASFSYTGSGRRRMLKVGGTSSAPKLTQTLDTNGSADGLEGLDRFGRVIDLHYKNTANTTLWQGEYGYDSAGNRTFERLTQRPHSSNGNGINTRSRLFGYDAFDRVKLVKSGELSGSPYAVATSDAYATVRTEGWTFDTLGNWNQLALKDPRTDDDPTNNDIDKFTDPCNNTIPVDPTGPSMGIPATDPGPGGIGTYPHGHWVSDSAGVKADSHLVQEADRSHLGTSSTQWERWQGWPHANTISRVRHDNVSADTHQWVTYRHDPCGNLTFDGEYFYQYDAWNRLVQVNAAGEMIWQLFVAAGVPRPVACEDDFLLGRLVKHFIYDGVGRLIRTSSPLEAPDGFDFTYTDGSGTHYVNAINRSERFFYDGTRRIQELITDPVLVTDEEHDTVSMSDEVYQSQSGGSVTLSGMYVRAQYIWGPGDGTNGVDELLCQLDPRDTSSSSYTSGGGKPWYILTDAQGDVVSITHLPVGSNQVIEVGGQWTYSPYGEVLTYEKLHPHPAVVFGHKTLPVDRLDAPALGWDTEEEGYSAETRRLIPGARLLGYNRGRTTNFKLGRFMQGDPNASGTTALTSMMFHGEAPTAFELTVDVQQRTGDGLNLFSYLGNSPTMRFDPMGLSYDPFDMVEDYLVTNAASTAAFMSRIVKGFNTTAHIAFQIAQLHPAVGMAVAAYNIASGQGSLWDVAAIVPGGAAVAIFAKASRALNVTRAAYQGTRAAAMIGRTMQRGQKILTITAEMAQHIGKTGTYAAMKILTKGAAHAIEAHHLIPTRYLGMIPNVTKNSAPAVVLAYEDHQMIEVLIRNAEEALGHAVHDANDLKTVLKEAYRDFPEYLDQIRTFLP